MKRIKQEYTLKGLPWWLRWLRIHLQGGRLTPIPGLGRSLGGGHGNPLQHSCLENPHGQRSLVGYSPWGHKKSDMTERLSTYFKIIILLQW